MSDLKFQEYKCICGTETYLKLDGTPWKHTTPQGAHCFGSSDPDVELADANQTVFRFEMSVYSTNPMLEDFGWHVSNKELASEAASREGYFPIEEADLAERIEEGNKVRLIYEVPVKEG